MSLQRWVEQRLCQVIRERFLSCRFIFLSQQENGACKTPHLLGLTQDIVALALEEKWGLKYVIYTYEKGKIPEKSPHQSNPIDWRGLARVRLFREVGEKEEFSFTLHL